MIGLIIWDTDIPKEILKKIKRKKLKYLIIDLSKKRTFKKDKNSKKVSIGQLLFYVGLFLLPSAFSISAILLIISSILGFFIQRENYFNDKWNIPFFLATLLLILSSIYNSLNSNDFFNYEGLININSHIGLFNWIIIIIKNFSL